MVRIEVVQDNGVDALECTKVRKDPEPDMRMFLSRSVDQARHVIGNMTAERQKVGEYRDFRDA
jgi:hypothetical protein